MSRANSKADGIRDEIRRKPCRDASELSEEYGVSPATVGRVVKNLDEELRRMRSLRMKKHVDDLYDIEYDILWIVVHQPGATQAEVKKAYEEHADISGLRGGHPETGDDAPDTVGDLWRDCLDAGWQGRTALANDLRELLDEDCVSDAAEQAVESLEEGAVDADIRPAAEAKEGTVRYMRYEIADAVGMDGEGRFIENANRELRSETLKAAADVLGVEYNEDITRKEISEKLAAEFGHQDVEFTESDGRFPKPIIKDLRDAVLEAVDEDDTDEDVDEPDHECEYCGDTFKSAAGRGKHEKHCDENPESESVEGTPSRDGDLTDTQRETVEAIVEHEVSEISDLVEVLDVGYGATNSRLNYIRQEGYDLYSGSLLEDAREILDDIDSEPTDDETDDEATDAAEDVDKDDQDESDDELEGVACPGEAEERDDDVKMQDVPTDRDIEQADEAAEDVVEDEEDEAPHVKNESGVDYERAIEQLQLMHEHGIQADRVEIYNEEGETKFDGYGVVLEG